MAAVRNCCRSRSLRCLKCSLCAAFWTSLVAGALAIALGVLYSPSRVWIQDLIYEEVALTPNSLMINGWLNIADVNATTYFFNLTNPEGVQFRGEKPSFKQVGPFGYVKHSSKYNVMWNQDETLVHYTKNITYDYSPELSFADPNNVNITTINIPLIGLLNLFENTEDNPKYRKFKRVLEDLFEGLDVVNEILKIEPLFITKTAEELQWGYKDPVFKLVHAVDPSLLPSAVFSLRQKVHIQSPIVVYSGNNDSNLRDSFAVWNGLTEIKQWGTPSARKIRGTDAAVFQPGLSRGDKIYAFTDEILISTAFVHDHNITLSGIDGFVYVVPKSALENSTMDPGYFPNGPSGVWNLSAVMPLGAPVYASKPHFCDADPYYLTLVNGLSPNKSKHDSYLIVEPLTGTTIGAAKRIQTNVRVTQNKKLDQLKKIQPLTMFPMFYAEECGTIDSDDAKTFSAALDSVKIVTTAGFWIVTGILGCLSLFMAVLTMVCLREVVKRRKNCTVGENAPLLRTPDTVN